MSRSTTRVLLAGSIAAATLTGCYVVPVAPDGTPIPAAAVALPAAPRPLYTAPMPSLLQARLYPSNEAAAQAGMLSGTVTNTMNGKGRFHLVYQGETLMGEATRVAGDDRSGTYRMNTPYQGTGTCTMSTGATYAVHLGG
jgi:hypothetical protein